MLEPLAAELWTAEVPLRYLGVEVGRRTSVVRLGSGALMIHSPAPLTRELRAELAELGDVRFVVPASDLHGHLGMEQYAAAYPHVELYAAPGLRAKRPDLTFAGELGDDPDPRWAADFDQAPLRGHRLHEFTFFHRRSRTLITGDLCFDIGPDRPWLTRVFAHGPRAGRRLGPTPLFRTFVPDKHGMRRSVERILQWDFERIIPGHGDVIESGGREAFREAMAWLG